MLNLSVLLEDAARTMPDRTALVSGAARMTYAEVEAAANRFANLLAARGLGRGDAVAVQLPNSIEFPVVYFGILKAGCVAVPLNPLLKRREIAYHLTDSQAKMLVHRVPPGVVAGDTEAAAAFDDTPGCTEVLPLGAGPDLPALAALVADQPLTFDTVATSPDDTAVILYTSGTTGQPKGAELTHSNLVLNATGAAELFGMSAEDVQLIVLPLFHIFGLGCLLNTVFLRGATAVIASRFEAGTVFELMQSEHVTMFAGVPTMYWELLRYDDPSGRVDLEAVARHLRLATSGGAALPVEIHRRFQERFGARILEGYGLSESSGAATFSRTDRPAKAGSIGVPIWGVELAVVDRDWNPVPDGDHGEIVIRGHNVMKGYFRRPEATAEVIRNGWFRTGDIGYRDEDGYFFVVDRAKDLIIRGGYNVYPRELEEVLVTHPAVSLAAVVGVPHDRHGEEVKAYVVPEPDSSVTADELIEWCRSTMAAYKYPRLLEIRETLPLSGTGKILKRELRECDSPPVGDTPVTEPATR
ncbi:long-chain-fatty-acid--CoA ligase [Rhodococcus ruber]|uniref:long-chain-fatty-acid--CoA ligase n=1 Tax=Rhodococcus ruber TaxID=1830 RepID=UPI00265DF803|nr:long-chain fatty acid--CoA ligase [Rhodococcus ruber]MDO1481607.1 long-chain fatty acid--CoA ligase [Rhodococcus ruber]